MPETAPAPDLGRVQRVDVYASGEVFLELFRPPEGRAYLGFSPSTRGLLTPEGRPAHPEDKPPAVQKAFREELRPSRLIERQRLGANLEVLTFEQPGGKQRRLWLEYQPADARAVLVAVKEEGDRILALVGEKHPRDGRDLRRGRLYAPPEGGEEHATPAERPGADERPPTVASAPPDDPTRDYRHRLRAEKKRLTRLVRALEGDLARHGDPDALAAAGELLKSALHHLERGQTEAVVLGPAGESVRVALDPRRSPSENLEQYFRRAKRAREAARRAEPRLADLRARLKDLERLHVQLLAAPYVDEDVARELDGILAERKAGGVKAKVARPSGPRRPWRAFKAHGGVVLRVGRSARDNDELTFHHARGNDTWVHARGAPGSHVIIPVARENLSPELLLDAAHLAAWFSPQRDESRVDVQYAAKKHVKKPGRNAAPGLVHLSKERVLHLVVEKARIRALLDAEVPAE